MCVHGRTIIPDPLKMQPTIPPMPNPRLSIVADGKSRNSSMTPKYQETDRIPRKETFAEHGNNKENKKKNRPLPFVQTIVPEYAWNPMQTEIEQKTLNTANVAEKIQRATMQV
ncbi:hypothetical protein ASPWEDRAFT_43686, partial [Aspergillus wentii DTO 134E9]